MATADVKVATDRSTQPSPQVKARLGGFLYLIVIVTAFFAEMFVRSTMIVSNNALLTSHSIMERQTLFRLGGAADLLNLCCDVALAIILYELLWPVDKTAALIAAAFRLIADACLICATFFHYVAVYVLSNDSPLRAVNTGQLQAFASAALGIHNIGYNISLVFFAVHCVLLGWLIVRSTFLPKVIGILFVITGVCYVINSFIHLVFPEMRVPIYFLLTGLISESVLMLWLLVFGVNVSKWRGAVAAAS